MSSCSNEEFRDLLPELAAERLSGAERARVAAHVSGCPACAAEVELLRAARHAMSRGVPAVDVGRIVAALPKPPLARAASQDAKPALVASSTAGSARGRAQVGTAKAKVAPPRRSSQWMGWRIAAAATIAVGGLSAVVIRHLSVPSGVPVATAPVSDVPAASNPTPAPTSSSSQPSRSEASSSSPSSSAPKAGVVATRPAPTGEAGATQSATPMTVAAADTTGLTVVGDISQLSDGDVESLLKDMDSLDAQPESDPDAPITPVPGLATQ